MRAVTVGRLCLLIGRQPNLLQACASRLARHNAILEDPNSDAPLSAADLRLVAGRMPQLRRLDCALIAPLQPPPLVLLPARLQGLTLRLPPSAAAADINCAIVAISQLVELRQLDLRLFAASPSARFSPLSALPLLRALSISCADEQGNDLPLTDAVH